jgi:hypothetical protein
MSNCVVEERCTGQAGVYTDDSHTASRLLNGVRLLCHKVALLAKVSKIVGAVAGSRMCLPFK